VLKQRLQCPTTSRAVLLISLILKDNTFTHREGRAPWPTRTHLHPALAMTFTLKHQKVHWEVDLDARALSGRAELQIEVTESLAELRLNCRQCKVSTRSGARPVSVCAAVWVSHWEQRDQSMHSACRGHAQSCVCRCGQAVRVVSKHYHGHMRSTGLCSVGTELRVVATHVKTELVVCEPPQLLTTAIGHMRLTPCAHAASDTSARASAS
jgi:hypothetical protein